MSGSRPHDRKMLAVPSTSRVAARSLTVEKFEDIAEKDSRVIAAFLGGSLASGHADDYSDIDMYYVIKPESYKEFLASIRSVIESIGSLAYFDQHSLFGFDLVLFMFQNGVKGEIGLGTAEKIKIMHAGPFKILVDKTDILQNLSLPTEKPPVGEDLRRYVEAQLRWYWYWNNMLMTALARDHLWSALQDLNTMRGHVWNLLKLSYGFSPNDRIERNLPPKIKEEMGSTVATYDQDNIRNAADTMTRILKRETESLIAKTGAEYPSLFEQTIRSKYQ